MFYFFLFEPQNSIYAEKQTKNYNNFSESTRGNILRPFLIIFKILVNNTCDARENHTLTKSKHKSPNHFNNKIVLIKKIK